MEGGALVQNFLKLLDKYRDQLCETSFQEEILKPLKLSQSSLHKEVLGDTLEGLVLHCFSPAENSPQTLVKQILKYKFPNYTCRTFALREILGRNVALDSHAAFASYKQYVGHWCYTEEGKRYWLDFLCACGLFVAQRKIAPKPGDLVGFHIRVADFTQQELKNRSSADNMSLRDEFWENARTRFESTVILVLGPIGYGKSTFSEFLAGELNRLRRTVSGDAAVGDDHDGSFSQNKNTVIQNGSIGSNSIIGTADILDPEDRFVHIDGDQLFFPGVPTSSNGMEPDNQDLVLTLSQERQPYTFWTILLALHCGKIPIVSQGGGIFFGFTPGGKGGKGNNDRAPPFLLRTAISDCFGAHVKIIACLPDRSSYNDADAVRRSVLWRLDKGLWNAKGMPANQFAKMIADKSVANKTFAGFLAEGAGASDKVYTYKNNPINENGCLREPGVDHLRDRELAVQIASEVVLPAQIVPETGRSVEWNSFSVCNFLQTRMLVQVLDENSRCAHITLRYGWAGLQAKSALAGSLGTTNVKNNDISTSSAHQFCSQVFAKTGGHTIGSNSSQVTTMPCIKVSAYPEGVNPNGKKGFISCVVVPWKKEAWSAICNAYNVKDNRSVVQGKVAKRGTDQKDGNKGIPNGQDDSTTTGSSSSSLAGALKNTQNTAGSSSTRPGLTRTFSDWQSAFSSALERAKSSLRVEETQTQLPNGNDIIEESQAQSNKITTATSQSDDVIANNDIATQLQNLDSTFSLVDLQRSATVGAQPTDASRRSLAMLVLQKIGSMTAIFCGNREPFRSLLNQAQSPPNLTSGTTDNADASPPSQKRRVSRENLEGGGPANYQAGNNTQQNDDGTGQLLRKTKSVPADARFDFVGIADPGPSLVDIVSNMKGLDGRKIDENFLGIPNPDAALNLVTSSEADESSPVSAEENFLRFLFCDKDLIYGRFDLSKIDEDANFDRPRVWDYRSGGDLKAYTKAQGCSDLDTTNHEENTAKDVVSKCKNQEKQQLFSSVSLLQRVRTFSRAEGSAEGDYDGKKPFSTCTIQNIVNGSALGSLNGVSDGGQASASAKIDLGDNPLVTHISQNVGRHQPKDMILLTQAIVEGRSSVNLPVNAGKGGGKKGKDGGNNSSIFYDLKTNATFEVVDVRLLGVFGVPGYA